MSKLNGRAVIAQGGGPTAVINQSLVGAVLEARKYECIENIIKDTIEKGYCTQIKSLAINGNILKEEGIKDGKRIGELLKFSLDHVLDYPNDNQKDVLIELCLKKEESEK